MKNNRELRAELGLGMRRLIAPGPIPFDYRSLRWARRFTGLVAIQEAHRLQTDGLYRYIRHPSYAGMLLYMAGFVLVFRCWVGLLLVAAMLAVLIARMNAEEALLESEFGEEYASYRRRSWRLVPCVY